MAKIVHIGVPYGYVPAIEVKDGLQLRVDKQYFVHHFLDMRSIEVQKMMLDFEIAIEQVTEQEVFIRFDSK